MLIESRIGYGRSEEVITGTSACPLVTKIKLAAILAALLMLMPPPARAQDAAAIQQKLVSEYALTQPTDALDDIVTAGAVVVLQKGPLMMVAASSSVNPYPTVYKNGKLKSASATAKGWRDKLGGVPGMSAVPGMSQTAGGPGTRSFVPGEKMWVTKIDVRENSVVLDLFTDAYSDVRYRTSLTFPFPKGSLPAAEDVEKLVGEVLKVQPAGDAKTDVQPQAHAAAQQAEPAVPAPAAEAPPPPIAPPPPPPADPKNISQGQTTDQVIASLGPPSKKVTLGVKQVYYYPDMKVIFVNGKVSDVQ